MLWATTCFRSSFALAMKRAPPRERVSDREASRAARYGHATVFLLDGRTYLESAGTWIAGASDAEFVIVSDQDRSDHLHHRKCVEFIEIRYRFRLRPR